MLEIRKRVIDILNKKKAKRELSWIQTFMDDSKKLYLNEKYLRSLKLLFENDDSKHIVDRATKRPIKEVLAALNRLDETDADDIKLFVEEYLHEPGHEITEANLPDWKEEPDFIDELKNDDLKTFSVHLNEIWHELYKKVDYSKLGKNCVSSHLPMKHPFVVPGGRFIEMYYWDTYWTMEGLLICGMFDTARNIIENFMHFIDQYGFIPNGTRIYYLNRSQPPYFSLMVMKYYEMSISSNSLNKSQKLKIKKFVLEKALNMMIKEYEFWMKERSVDIYIDDKKKFKLNIFKANTNKPRPESYFEDLHTAKHCETEEEKMKCYMDIATAAESGYDFSSRWFRDPMSMETIQTSDIIPVDLNAVLYKNEVIIAELCSEKGDSRRAKLFRKYALKRKNAINHLLWSDKMKCWCDFNLATQSLNDIFYISNLMPLCVDITPPNASVSDVIQHHMEFLDVHEGGIPVSLVDSSQQWDYPNAWAPNQHSIIFMLMKYDRKLALKLARKFFNTVYQGWQTSRAIFEKYDSSLLGKRGCGGEYTVQTGFGWTNGVVFSLINTFKDDLIDPDYLA